MKEKKNNISVQNFEHQIYGFNFEGKQVMNKFFLSEF